MDEIAGLPRHISQHSGGMVISSAPLVELVPVLPAAMEGRRICQWDKDSCADAGFLKIDLLGLGMLSAVEECVDLIARTAVEPVDLSRIGFDDPEVFAEIQAADTVGVFQIESRAQMQSLRADAAREPRRPDRAGRARPAGADRRRRRQPVHQAPPGAAPRTRVPRCPTTIRCSSEVLRRHAGRGRVPGPGARGGDRAGRLHHRGRRGAAPGDEPQAQPRGARGPLAAVPRRRGRERRAPRRRPSWCSTRSSASRSSASPSPTPPPSRILAYQSAWLHRHYPAEFLCSLLNAQPMGFYPPATLLRDGERRGVDDAARRT